MTGLLYRPDMDAVRTRLKTWWDGGDIGRPALAITVPRETPVEIIPVMPQPEGWVTEYSTSNYAYRVNLAARQCINTHYLAEAVPAVSPDLAPNCLALYLGCHGVDMPGTVWCEPIAVEFDELEFQYDPANFYWQFSQRLAHDQLKLGHGKFLLQFPDLIEGLDTLAAMRGTDNLLIDLIERPDWVHNCLRKITDVYFRYYDILYDLMRDEVGGSIYWLWAPGRMVKLQCDFSAMISPAMFGDFMLPILTEMCERVSYPIYHWDGPGAIPHHNHLLSIPRLKMIQWTPGAGADTTGSRRWYPLYHKTIDAGKKVLLYIETIEEYEALAKEFGHKLKQFYLIIQAPSIKEANRLIHLVSD